MIKEGDKEESKTNAKETTVLSFLNKSSNAFD